MSEFDRLENLVNEWAKDKGILQKATPIKQLEKTKEEIDELSEALIAQNNGLKTYINSKNIQVNTDEQIIDGIGDSLVTLIIQCKLQGISALDCLEVAYNEIADRKGQMINGKFVKNSN